MMQFFGLGCTVLLAVPAFWGWRLVTKRRLERARLRLMLAALGLACGVAAASLAPAPGGWPLPTGLGGVAGDALLTLPRALTHGSSLQMMIVGAALVATAIVSLSAAVGARRADGWEEPEQPAKPIKRRPKDFADPEEDDNAGEMGLGLVSLGAFIHGVLMLRGALRRMWARKPKASLNAFARAPWLSKASPKFQAPLNAHVAPPEPRAPDLPSVVTALRGPMARSVGPHAVAAALIPDAPEAPASRVMPSAGPLKAGKRAAAESQLNLFRKEAYEFPPLVMLAEPKKSSATRISEDALEQNARLLEGVLEDFGVKGEIVNVRPGPVVTLYELEPAPGIKSSRVIGLADDIARSMSAISARVAVVQGRNAIGIELPNQRRETVFLRELLASQDFETTKRNSPSRSARRSAASR